MYKQREQTRHSLLVAAVTQLVFGGACTPENTVNTPTDTNQVQLRQAVVNPGAAVSLRDGEDCERLGREACPGKLCLHIGQRPNDKFVCVMTCVEDDDCPAGWNCLSLERQKFCAPPSDFSPRPVTRRPPGPPRPPRPPPQLPSTPTPSQFAVDAGRR